MGDWALWNSMEGFVGLWDLREGKSDEERVSGKFESYKRVGGAEPGKCPCSFLAKRS